MILHAMNARFLTRRESIFFALCSAILLLPQAEAAPAPVWLAVSPDQKLLDALEPLAAHRRAQGFRVVTSTTIPDEAIVTLGAAPDYLLLIGTEKLIPSKRGEQYRWRAVQPETFAADPLFSDLDADGLPDFPVGRIPVDNAAQLSKVVAKTIAYEKRKLSAVDLNLPVWSGTPAYGKLLEETADWLLLTTLNKYAPDWAQPWLITSNPNNPLNGWPLDHGTLFNDQILKGAAFSTMMGHGNVDIFLSMETPEGNLVYSIESSAELNDTEQISSPLVIFACDCGNFAHKRHQSLAAAMLLARGGPVVTIAATTESHPLTNYYSSICLMGQLSEPDHSHRAGDLWLAAQLAAVKVRKPLIERTLKNVEGALEAKIDIPKLKRDQTHMYAYLGDPALQMALPRKLEIQVSKTTTNSEKAWKWDVATKPEGVERVLVQLRKKVTDPIRIKPEGANREESLKLFKQRNAQFEFETLAELNPTDNWNGTIKSTPGELRIIAIGKDAIHVAVEELR